MKVTSEFAGQRLDVYLTNELDELSRSHIAKLVREGNVRVNDQSSSPAYKVQLHDDIQVDVPTKNKQKHLTLTVLHEDNKFIVIDKPQGLLVHAKDNRNAEATVQELLSKKIQSDTPRGGIVHRLDRDTSGVMVLAKSANAHALLKDLFQQRTIKKRYIARVSGQPKDNEAILKWPIARWPKHPALFRVDANGKPAETLMQVEEAGTGNSLVALYPKTGRTHQLRVHMAHYGNPILGDRFYNPKYKTGEKLMLHAQRLEFKVDNKLFEFESPVPKRFL